MQVALSVASRSEVPPAALDMPPKAPWLGDLMSSVCLACSKEFGVFNRRHHCRACGGLFCDVCSSHKVKGVPGYDPNREERVCEICFYNDIAIIVVWNQFFSGWHFKFYGEYPEAHTKYQDIPDYASRLIMKVGTGFIYESYFKNDQWKQRVMDHAYTQVRKVLRPRIPLLWHAAGGNAAQQQQQSWMSAPASMTQGYYNQLNTAPSWVSGGNSYHSGGGASPSLTPSNATLPQSLPALPYQTAGGAGGASATAPPGNVTPREASAGELQTAVLVVFRQTDGEATDHTWLFFPNSSRVEVLEEAGRFLRAIPRLSYGGVLDLSGELCHFSKLPDVQGTQSAFAQLFKTYMDNVSCMLAKHEGGEFQTTFFTKLGPAVDAASGTSSSVVLLDMSGNIVLTKNCASSSWQEGLCKRAGLELMKQQSFSALVGCGPNQVSHVFDDMYSARLLTVRSAGFALFAIPANASNPTPVLLQRHLFMTKAEALELSESAQAKTRSLITRQRVLIPEQESASARSAVANRPECGICFLAYNVDQHKPCLCSKCGNSMCLTCIRSVSLCPFCRVEMPISGPWITNVQLLQLLSGTID